MISECGAKIDVINGSKIWFQRELADGSRWCCTRKTCRAYLKKDIAGNVTDEHLNHNHELETAYADGSRSTECREEEGDGQYL